MPRAPKRLVPESKNKKSKTRSESSQSSKRLKKVQSKENLENMPSKTVSKQAQSRSALESLTEGAKDPSRSRLQNRQSNDFTPRASTECDEPDRLLDNNFDGYTSESSLDDDFDDELDFAGSPENFAFPFMLSGGISGGQSVPDFVEGLSSSDVSKVTETLERLNDFVNMSFDDISFSLPVPQLLSLLFKLLSQPTPSAIAAQIISVFIDSSMVASKLVASNPSFMSILRRHIDSMTSLEIAEQCVVIVSRMVKDYAKEIGKSGIAGSVLRSLSFFSQYTQKQCMQILEDLVSVADSGEEFREQLADLLMHDDSSITQKASSCWLRSLEHCTGTPTVSDSVFGVLSTSHDSVLVGNILKGLVRVVVKTRTVSASVAEQLVQSGGLKLSRNPPKDLDLLFHYADLLSMLIWTSGDQDEVSAIFFTSICMPFIEFIFCHYREMQTDSTTLFVMEFFKRNSPELGEHILPVCGLISRMLECPQSYQLVTLLGGLEIANVIKTILPSALEDAQIGPLAQRFVSSIARLPETVKNPFKAELAKLVGGKRPRKPVLAPIDYDSLTTSNLVELLELEIEKLMLRDQFAKLPGQIFEHPVMLQIGQHKSIAEPSMTVGGLLELIEDSCESEIQQHKELSFNGYQISWKDSHSMTILEAIILSWKRDECTFKWRLSKNTEEVFLPKLLWSDDEKQDGPDRDSLKAFLWSKKPHVVEVCSPRSVGEKSEPGFVYPEAKIVDTRTPGDVAGIVVDSSLSESMRSILACLRAKFDACIEEGSTESFGSRRLDRLVHALCRDRLLFGNDNSALLKVLTDYAPFVLSVESKAELTRRRFDPFQHAVSKRQKVKLDRSRVLTAGMAVLDLFGSSSPFAGRTVLEMEFTGEVGSGSGPTNEFYAMCCEQLKHRSNELFRECSDGSLFPRIEKISREEVEKILAVKRAKKAESENGTLTIESEQPKTVLDYWWFMGLLVGRGIADNRLVDLNFSWVLWHMVHAICCGRKMIEVDAKWIKFVDPAVGRSLDALLSLSDDDLGQLEVCADIMPGREDYKLSGPLGGKVDKANVSHYHRAVISASLLDGVFNQIYVFTEALCSVVGKDTMAVWVNPQELTEFVAGSDISGEAWCKESLRDAFRAEHGYTTESRQIQDLVEIVSEMDGADRKKFVKFVTGSNRLPLGGFKALEPPLTVVKASRDDEDPDSYLPSVMTCANFIKLPEYSSKAIMRNQLITAISDGQGSFLLS